MKERVLFLIGILFVSVNLAYAQPDLVVTIDQAPAIAVIGSTITVSNSIINQGASETASFRVEFYLSDNYTISIYDTLIGSRSVNSLAPAATSTADTSLTLPAEIKNTGVWWLGAIVDPANTIKEVSESNNIAYRDITLDYDDGYEENDTLLTAKSITSDNYMNLKCYDTDWYKIYLSEDDSFKTTISFSHPNGNLDMEFYGTDGVTLLATSTGTTDSESISIGTVSASGYYYIKVYGYEGALNTYSMVINIATIRGSISGWVTRAFDSKFISGANVEAIPVGTAAMVTAVQTNPVGLYTIPGLKAGTYTVRVVSPEYGTQTKDNIVVKESQNTPNINLTFTPALTITPAMITNAGTIAVTLKGPGFPSGSIFSLIKSGQPNIIGTNTSGLNSTTVVTVFNLTGVQTGTWSLILTLSSGSTYTLTPNFMIFGLIGSIRVTSSPEGANIYLDGRNTALTTPATLTGMAIGTHTIGLTQPKYFSFSDICTVKLLETTLVDVSLKRSTGEIQLSVVAGEYTDPDNFVGLRDSASDAYDGYDVEKSLPSPSGGYISLGFPHLDWGMNAGNYSSDYRQLDDLAYNRKIWDFEVVTREIENTDITISWSPPLEFPSGYNLFLLHGTTTIDLRATSSYTYNNGTSSVQNFKLAIGEIHRIYHTYTAGWNMISFPAIHLLADPVNVFGNIPPDQLKLYHWTGTGYKIFDFHSPDSFGPLTLSTGYWLKPNTATQVEVMGHYIDSTQDYIIPIKPGWNQIGAPFKGSVNWSSARVVYGTQTVDLGVSNFNEWLKWTLYRWEGTGYRYDTEGGGQLDPWQGYWVKSNVACDLIISPTAPAPAAKLLKSAEPSLESWYVKISAQGGGYDDECNIAGVGAGYSDAHDPYDVDEPSFFDFSPYLSLYFPHPNGDSKYTHNYRQPIVGSTTKTWEFEIRANKLANIDVSLTWPVVAGVPDNYNLFLIDIDDGNRIIDMRIARNYLYNTGNNPIRHFKFMAGIISLPSIKASAKSNLITIIGQGFNPNEQIVLNFGLTPSITSCLADTEGSFTVSFMVNPQISGEFVITAVGNKSDYQPANIVQISPARVNDENLQSVYAFPNPFSPPGKIKFVGFGVGSNPSIQIFNIAGEQVVTIDKDEWDGRNEEGKEVAGGIYIYLITNDKDKKIGKLAVVK